MRTPRKRKPVPPKVLAALKQIIAHSEQCRLRPLEYAVLDLVAPGSLSQIALHAALESRNYRISIGQVSRVITVLEGKQLVARNAGPNARTKRLTLTQSGRKEAKQYEEYLGKLALEFLKRSAHPVVELHLNCPSCSRMLRISKHGPRVKNRCPSCAQQFFVRFEDEICVVEPCGVQTREPETALDPYEELQVPRGATREQITTSKRSLLKRYHPDVFHNLGPDFVALATKRSQRINAAFDRLV